MGCFNNTGQVCYAGTRLFVERSIYDDFVAEVARVALAVGEDIEAITSGGDGLVGLCGSYLSDALRSMQSDHVEVGLAGELEPIVVRDGVAERTSASVIMPMRA
jgi:hypothetical protein